MARVLESLKVGGAGRKGVVDGVLAPERSCGSRDAMLEVLLGASEAASEATSLPPLAKEKYLTPPAHPSPKAPSNLPLKARGSGIGTSTPTIGPA